MKIAAFALFAALPLAAAAQVSKEDIKKLAAAGVSEDVILTYVRTNGGAPRMSADDIIELKQAGVGDRVLGALAGMTTVPAPSVVERVVEKPVYVPQTTYVTSSYDYYEPYAYAYRPVYYTSSWYPRYYYSGWCGPSYRSSFHYSSSHCRPRVGISLGWRW
jgi:hypothetical protein